MNLLPTKRAAIYIRVSSDKQVIEGYSLPQQLEICQQFCKSRGWHHTATFCDDGYSAKTTERPAFQEMLGAASNGEFDIIVVHKLDRFSRSIVDVLVTLRELEKTGITFSSASEVFDFSTPWGMVILVLIAAFAEWYLANLSEETKKGKLGRALDGEWGGRLPFGYTAHYKKDGGDGTAIPDPQTQEGYLLAIRLAQTGRYSYRKIANELNTHGYRPTGKAGERSLGLWSRDSVVTMLQNRFYLGELYHNGTWYPGNHTPLIPEAEWHSAQQAMASRRSRNRDTRRMYTRIYLFSGMVKCSECGSPMRGTYYQKSGKEYRYYRCSGPERGIECKFGQISAGMVEETAGEWIASMDIPEAWEQLLRQHLNQTNKSPTQNLDQQLRVAEDKLARLKDLYMLGDIERHIYLYQREELQSHITALKTQLSNVVPVQTVQTATLLKNVKLMWTVATPDERQEWFRSIVSEVILYPDKKVYLKINPNLTHFFCAVGILPEVGVVGFEPTLCAF